MASEPSAPLPTRRYVLAADVTFGDIEQAFAEWQGGPTDRHQWLGGEPVGASWTRDGSTVTYSANPAIGLRVLESADKLPTAVRLMTADEAKGLINDPDPAVALLGTTALGMIGGVDALPQLHDLAADDDLAIAAAAQLALRRIGSRLISRGATVLADRQAAAPDKSALFASFRSADTRRQVLRWLLRHPPHDRDRVVSLLRTGLEDDDWEVRWTAVVGIGMFSISELVAELKRCPLDDKIERTDRQILEALRSTIGSDLVGRGTTPVNSDHLRACLTGSTKEFDRAFLLIQALREPLPETIASNREEDYCVIPSVLHWVGDPDVVGHPVRSIAAAASFEIMREPTVTTSSDAVSERISQLSASSGRPLRLPTPLELEMACRGPDGRRYPWGNGRSSGALHPSPWGLERPLADPEWVQTDEGNLMVLGGGGTRSCAGPMREASTACLRLVVI